MPVLAVASTNSGLVVDENLNVIGPVLDGDKIVPAVAVDVDKEPGIIQPGHVNTIVAGCGDKTRSIIQVEPSHVVSAMRDIQVEQPILVNVTHCEPAAHDLDFLFRNDLVHDITKALRQGGLGKHAACHRRRGAIDRGWRGRRGIAAAAVPATATATTSGRRAKHDGQ